MQLKRYLIFIVILIFVFFVFVSAIQAQEKITLLPNNYFIHLDKITVAKGYIVRSLDNNFRLNITPETLDQETGIEIKKIPPKELLGDVVSEWRLVSDIFEFDIKNKQAYNREKPLIIRIQPAMVSNNLKKIYYWDDQQEKWIVLPSKSDPKNDLVQAAIHLPYAKVAIFEDSLYMESGLASWYGYKGCNCAASPDYSKGTRLKVINLDNNKSVVVKINDWGPDRRVHPDRVIDLDKIAFNKIASLRRGVVWVKVEPI